MKKLSFLLLVLFYTFNLSAENPQVLDWSSPEGIKRLEHSRYKVDFFKLANNFEGQMNRIFCGPTSATIVLNSFRLGKDQAPEDPANFDKAARKYLPKDFNPLYKKYTQNTFFSEPVSQVKSKLQVLGQPIDGKAKFGIELETLNQMLQAQGLKTTVRIADENLKNKTIMKELKDNLKRAGDYVIVNFARAGLGQKGGGHISPLGAYDASSDSFLVLDVAPNVAPWSWVKSDILIKAMRTRDEDAGKNRGYILVSE